MDLTLLKDGVFVMVIGMGTVFVFLTIMIWVMQLNSKILLFVNKYFPEEVPVEKKSNRKVVKNEDEEIALAIACAMVNAGKQTA